MDTITPDDLALYRQARQQCAQTEVQLQQAHHAFQQAQQAFQQAQAAHIETSGALKFVTRTIASRPGFPEGASFDPNTGAITVASPASPGAQAASGPHGIDHQATSDRLRKVRAR